MLYDSYSSLYDAISDAIDTYERLYARLNPFRPTGLLHGRYSDDAGEYLVTLGRRLGELRSLLNDINLAESRQ